MKVLFSILFLCVTSPVFGGDQDREDLERKVEEKVREGMEEWRKVMPFGFPDNDVPPVDPFFIEREVLHYVNGSLNVRVVLLKSTLTGSSNFSLTELTVDLSSSKLTMAANFPMLYLKGNYEMNGTIFKVMPIYGKGDFQVAAIRPWIKLISTLNITKQGIRLNKVEVDADWVDSKMEMKGFLGNIGDAIQGALPSITKFLFKTYKTVVLNEIALVLRRILNPILDNPMVRDIAQRIFEGVAAV